MLPEGTRLRLEHQLDCLAILLQDISPERVQQRPASGKWSAAENLSHLARYHEIFLERVRRILAERAPVFPRYRAEDDAAWPGISVQTASDAISHVKQTRRELISLLEDLPSTAWARTGTHPVFGEMKLVVWLEFFLLHEAHHLLTVMQRVREPLS